VFDPLAVMLVIAYNQALILRSEEKESSQGHPEFKKLSWWKKMWEMYGDKEQEIVEDDERMDIIGQNGNDGLHYDEVDIPNEPLEENDPNPQPTKKDLTPSGRGGIKI
jgi:hypothetical protein